MLKMFHAVLGCYEVLFCQRSLTFWCICVHSSARSSGPKKSFEITRQFSSGSSSLDYGSIAIIRNIRNYSSVTRCHVPEDLTLQQNCCEILISCPAHTCFKTDWKMSNSKIKHNFIFKCACGYYRINHLNTKSNPICHLLALLGAHPILHVSRIRVNNYGMFVAEERVIQIGM